MPQRFPSSWHILIAVGTGTWSIAAVIPKYLSLRLRETDGHYRLIKQIDGRTLSDDFYIPSNITFPTPVYP